MKDYLFLFRAGPRFYKAQLQQAMMNWKKLD